MNRRRFLAGAAAAGWVPGLWTPARAAGLRRTAATAASTAGTTLESTVAVVATEVSGYRRLGVGPGWPVVVRTDLAAPAAGREGRRRALAAFGHLTDVHLIDSQSPARVEFTDRLGLLFTSAFRAQETLTTQVGSAMVERINGLAGGPHTGRALDCVVSTGDNIDNQQHNELAWFLTLLDGGRLVPDSGAVGTYEGVQDADPGSYDPHYWHPDPPPPGKPVDEYKALAGFPELPGLLAAAIAAFDTPGLRVPWFSTYGNHDGLLSGNVNGVTLGLRPLDPLLTGPVKPLNLAAVPTPANLSALLADPALLLGALGAQGVPVRVVTPDPERRAVAPEEWIRAHLDSPTGTHGYTEDHLATANLDYTFDVSPEVLGISLDTVNHGGYADGSLGASQLAWLEARLAEVHGRHLGPGGTEVTTGHADRLVLLFSHHNLGTIANVVPDPADPLDRRLGPAELLAVLRRFPNVVAWVNGHTHMNRVSPVGDPTGYTGGFWEITTAAHVDHPEHARVVEVVDNADGTLSILATILEHAGPATVDHDDRSVLGLASLSRELSANDPQPFDALGVATDLNVELVLRAPFDLSPAAGAGGTPTTPTTLAGAGAGGTQLPATGPSVGLAAGAAAVGAALALRRRGSVQGSPSPPTQED